MALDYNRASFWVSLAGLIGLPLAVLLTYLSFQHERDLAKESGALQKPHLVLGIGGGLPLEPDVETKILFAARTTSHDKAVVIGVIPFVVSNVGDATLENTTVTFRFHKMFHRDAFEMLKFSSFGGFEASQIQRSFTTGGELQYSSYLIPDLNPGQTMAGTEPLYLPRTNSEFAVPVQTHDNKSLTVSMKLEFGIQFLLSIAAKNIQTRDYPMEFETTEATSLEELSERAMTTKISREILKVRKNSTFGQYFRALTFGVPDENLYLVFEDLDEHQTENGMLYMARPDPKIRLVSYKPVSWRLLFK